MRPYSPETLAERWDCSPEKIRRMYHAGEIQGFRLGKLIRIPAAEVERFECLNTESSNIEDDSVSPSQTASEGAFASRLARMTGVSPKLAPVTSGGSVMQRRVTG